MNMKMSFEEFKRGYHRVDMLEIRDTVSETAFQKPFSELNDEHKQHVIGIIAGTKKHPAFNWS